MKDYRNYVFDLYGTLVDIHTDQSLLSLWEDTVSWFAQHGAFYGSTDECRSSYLRLCQKEQKKSPDPLYEIELRNVFLKMYAEKGVTADAALIEETAVRFRTVSTIKCRLYPWVLPVFSFLRKTGKKIFLLSNAQTCFTMPELKKLGIAEAFDGIVISSDEGVKKPSEKILKILTDRYELKVSESVMIGNDQHCDILMADRCGMDSLYIETETSPAYDSEIKATYEIRKDEGPKKGPVRRILITAFEPFGGESVNASALILEALPDRIGSASIHKLLLPVVFGKAAEKAMQEAERIGPDAIVCLGQAGGRDAVTPERIAVNVTDARIPDNAGNQPEDEPIDPEGPAAVFSTLPVKEMADAMAKAGVPAKVSYTAGTFVCNDLMYEMIYAVSLWDKSVPCGFIHVPYLKGQADEAGPALALEDAVKGITAATETLVS